MSKDYLNSTPTADYSTDRQPFFGREWAFQKLIREPGMVINSLNCSLVLADVGGGKSSLLHHIRHNPHLCSGTLLAYFQCSRSTSAFDFVFSVASQLQSKIPYLQVPSREQLAQLYHFHHGPRTIARSDATDEPSVASQCSVRSIIDRSDMDSIDLLTTTTSASDRFHSSTYSFPLAPASSATLNTPAAAHNPAPTSSVHYSRFSNVSPLSPSCSPVPVNRCSPNFYRPPAARNSPGSSPDAGSVESGNTCTLSTAAAYVITGTSNAALHSSSVLSSQSRRHDVREDVFWRYVLEPIIDHGLNRWEDQCFLLLIDSIDDQPEICELLSRHLLLLPNFLHVIVTARSTRRKGFS